MPYKLKVNLPNLSKDAPVAILGLGEFANGSTVDVGDELVAQFAAVTAGHVPQFDKDGAHTHDEFVLGDIEAAFKDNPNLVLTKVKATQSTEGGDK